MLRIVWVLVAIISIHAVPSVGLGQSLKSLAGTWASSYTCDGAAAAQAEYTIGIDSDGIIHAIVGYHITDPYYAPGVFRLTGRFEPGTGRFELVPDRWVSNPNGHQMVGILGEYHASSDKLDAQFTFACQGLVLMRQTQPQMVANAAELLGFQTVIAEIAKPKLKPKPPVSATVPEKQVPTPKTEATATSTAPRTASEKPVVTKKNVAGSAAVATDGATFDQNGDKVHIDPSRNTIIEIKPGQTTYVADGFFCEAPVFSVAVAHNTMVERLIQDPDPVHGFLRNVLSNLTATLCPQYSYSEKPQRGRVFVYDPDGLAGELSYVFQFGGLMTGRDDKIQVSGRKMRGAITAAPPTAYIEDYLSTGRINIRNDSVLESLIEDPSGEGNYLVGTLTPERWPEHAPAKASAIVQGFPLALYDRAHEWLQENGVMDPVRRGLEPPELTEAQIAEMTVLVEDAVATRYVLAIPLAKAAAAAGADLGSINDIYDRRGVTKFGYSRPKPKPGVPPTHRELNKAMTKEMIVSRCNWISLFFDKYAKRQQHAGSFGVVFEKLTPLKSVCHIDALDTLGYEQFVGVNDVMNESCRLDASGTKGLCSFNFTFHCETSYAPGRQQPFDICTFLRFTVAGATAGVELRGEQWETFEIIPEKLAVNDIWEKISK